MKLKIIYEDNNVIVIDKPAGIAAHPRDEHDKSETIASLLYALYPEIKNVGDNAIRPGIVHRLDKETSGLMVVAKNNETFYELKKLFQERKIEKKYIALVSGMMEKDRGVIETELVKIGTRTSVRHSRESGNPELGPSSNTSGFPIGSGMTTYTRRNKSAVTEYKVTKRYKEYTLVEVTPKTGRQHQIRVHFASINHPIACDKLYGRKAKKCPSGLRRHFLHASYLKFRLKNALMEFDSELPQDLETALLNLE